MQVLEWYNQINSFMLDYISRSVKESDLSSFYRLIIAFKNLQRSVEFSGKSGIFGIRYIIIKISCKLNYTNSKITTGINLDIKII